MTRSGRTPPHDPTPADGGKGAHSPLGWEHIAQFYDDDDFLCDAVADFLADGLLLGEPLVVLSTERHRRGLSRRLAAAGLDWDDARRSRRLRWVDARAALDTVMVGRVPDAERFERHIGGIIRASLDGGNSARVRAYGEMVDLLWRDGNADAALRIEDLWNDLGREHPFSLLCAYTNGNIYREDRGQRHRQVCDRHSLVLPAEND